MGNYSRRLVTPALSSCNTNMMRWLAFTKNLKYAQHALFHSDMAYYLDRADNTAPISSNAVFVYNMIIYRDRSIHVAMYNNYKALRILTCVRKPKHLLRRRLSQQK